MDNMDLNRVQEAALALLYLTLHDGDRVWKSIDWDVMESLHERGLIDNPKNQAKSVLMTEAGLASAKAACEKLFSADS